MNMIQRDFIMRQAEILARALAKILLHKEQLQFEQALDEIVLAGKELLGADFPILMRLSDTDLIKWLYPDGNTDSSKALFMTQLLKAEGEVLELKGELQQSRVRYLQAFHLLTEVLAQNQNYNNEENKSMLEWLSEKTLNEKD
jgi:hypothetical protein